MNNRLNAMISWAFLIGALAIARPQEVHSATSESPRVPSEQLVTFDIAPQPLDAALSELAQQADIALAFYSNLGQGLKSHRLVGTLTPRRAFNELLANTPLTAEFIDERNVVIRESASSANKNNHPSAEKKLRVASAGPNGPAVAPLNANDDGANSAPSVSDDTNRTERFDKELQEILVTGTHIRGATPVSPVIIVSRDDIETSGAGTVQDVLAKVPQNFGGGITETTSSSNVPGQDQGNNVSNGTGVNLRGLGSDATLVLLNGHRLTATGAGNFVDISQVPASAVERIEILLDGASAIYGADAVGGVVNIILRDRYEGAETRARYGQVTSGGLNEYGAGQTIGGAWGSGGGLITYDFYDRKELTREHRPFASDPVRDLLPAQKHNSVLIAAHQSLWQDATFSIDGLYSDRRSHFDGAFATPPGSPSDILDSREKNYSINGTLKAPVIGSWVGELTALTSSSKINWQAYSVGYETFGQPAFQPGDNFTNRLSSLQAKIDGNVIEIPGGTLKGVLGAEYRHETYLDEIPGSPPRNDNTRNVSSVFTEIHAPLVSHENSLTGVRRLELSAAVRYEHYSDFGSSTNPQFGVLWQPAVDWTLRATRSNSFRAPNFSQTATFLDSVLYYPFPDPRSPSGTTNTLELCCSKTGLGPEKSTTTSVSVEFAPQNLKALRLSLTYFDTKFRDRVAQPDPAVIDMLINESVYGPLVTRNPTQAQIASALAYSPVFQDLTGGVPATSAGAIVDDRYQNLSITKVSGVDFQESYDIETSRGKINLTLAGTRLITFRNQIDAAAPYDNVLNTLFNPLRLKARAGLGWTLRAVSANLLVNYTASYQNNTTVPAEPIASWSTADLSAAYATGALGSIQDLSFRLSVQNILDKSPPFVRSPTNLVMPVGYDPANASPLGRFLSLGVTAKW